MYNYIFALLAIHLCFRTPKITKYFEVILNDCRFGTSCAHFIKIYSTVVTNKKNRI